MKFGLVTNSNFFTGVKGDLEAIVGMSYQALAQPGVKSMPDMMLEQ